MKRQPRGALRLPIELVPAPLWNRTLARLGLYREGREIWSRIREIELQRAGGRCEVCGGPARDVHEKWQYDDRTLVQRLRGFEVLCEECHLVHHQGFAGVHALADVALKRFMKVNSLSKTTARSIVRSAFDLWAARSAKGRWTQDVEWLVSKSKTYGFEPDRIQETLGLLLKAQAAYRWSELRDVPAIGPVRAEVLEDMGIRSIGHLAAIDPADLIAKLRLSKTRDWSFTTQVPMAVRFARALRAKKPLIVSHRPLILDSDDREILFVDLEYDPQDAFIFLIGTMTMDGQVVQDFIETPAQLPRALTRFLRQIAGSSLRCISYGSTSADVPMLKKAAATADLDPSLTHLLPFLDLFRDVIFTQNPRRQWLYLPLKPMDAKSVAHYFGYDPPRNLAIHDGFEALIRYKEYARTHNARIRKQLLRYNESDLKLTRRIFEELRDLEAGRADIQQYRLTPSVRARHGSPATALSNDFH